MAIADNCSVAFSSVWAAKRGQFDIANSALDVLPDRYADPLYTLRGLDEITIAPIVLCELHVVVKYEFIDSRNHVEVALPRDVIGLEDSNFFYHSNLIFLHSN